MISKIYKIKPLYVQRLCPKQGLTLLLPYITLLLMSLGKDSPTLMLKLEAQSGVPMSSSLAYHIEMLIYILQ